MYKKLYFYKCITCEKKRQTFCEDKATEALCGVCRRTRVSEDQLSLFGDKAVGSVDK